VRSTYPVGGGRPPLSFGESMRLLVPALISVLLCGCGGETHVRNKVYSVLPQIEQDIDEGGVEQAFAAEILNPWVRALDTSRVVARLQIALDEVPQYRRATLWMLKAYAPLEAWQTVAARYPDRRRPCSASQGMVSTQKSPNQTVQRTGASRFAQRQI